MSSTAGAEDHSKERVTNNLKRQLEAVHSIQHMEERVATSGTQQTTVVHSG